MEKPIVKGEWITKKELRMLFLQGFLGGLGCGMWLSIFVLDFIIG